MLENTQVTTEIDSFDELQLEPRLVKAIQRAGFLHPTPVQCQGLPCLLGGKDALISAPTGTGKTVCYAVPIIHQLLKEESTMDPNSTSFHDGMQWEALVLVPTKELAYQVTATFQLLNRYNSIRTLALLQKQPSSWQKVALTHILVTTPATLLHLLQQGTYSIKNLKWLVVDEADLLFSFGYEQDMQKILPSIPAKVQSVFVSATLDKETYHFLRHFEDKRHAMQQIRIKHDVTQEERLQVLAKHHYVQVEKEQDKYLVVFALIKLQVLKGKILIFVNSVDKGFRLKLLLDQFYIHTSLLNAELPLLSRLHSVEQFNQGKSSILIATDEACIWNQKMKSSWKANANTLDKEKTKEQENEFDLSRGMDFQQVAVVLNLDCPYSLISYIHRAGRTARAGKAGDILTLVTSEEMPRLQNHFEGMGLKQEQWNPLKVKMSQVEPFRYRVEDCLYKITKNVLKEARATEIRREMLNSEKMKEYFAHHALDFEALKSDRPLNTRTNPHLADIPSYLMPSALRPLNNGVSCLT
ncbi:ATP-dependent RNA helicase [Galdieria sulphuraria]|uniref:RNA helicase n=1 Tax=Galdieria sulphuraria TaxID=130081 RepID=M2XD96_GALSU|nr:ATP-dependent RNA helicase [Galdieria sulphuraria]EME27917.1 ATP-dependent RNA helicase [Galdieria sulphuraria]|eukprot:XP_005704437.1 ATP-dependent RNA helicase [Galdieria sulphuraria]